ncbi:MAG: TerB family tellurite resistance protein [Cyclobacteriaceae bacterium]
MKANSELYDAFGELIYVLAMADGEIQPEEKATLEHILQSHPWSREILWSFNYESAKNNDVEDTYKKVLQACYDVGPDPAYQFMIEVLEAVGKSSIELDEKEKAVIERFKTDLTTEFNRRFEKD